VSYGLFSVEYRDYLTCPWRVVTDDGAEVMFRRPGRLVWGWASEIEATSVLELAKTDGWPWETWWPEAVAASNDPEVAAIAEDMRRRHGGQS
jgi:hypothetical protein